MIAHLLSPGEPCHLRRTEGMKLHARPAALEPPEKISVKAESQRRVHASLQQKLVTSQSQQLPYLPVILLIRGHIGILVLFRTAEVAEPAL